MYNQSYTMKPDEFCFPHIIQTFSDVNAFRTAYAVYFEEGIRSPRIYLAFVRLFVVSVDLECSTSQNLERHS